MIEVKELSKKFGEHWALKNTSWKVGEKRAIGLLGPNGAGKSTSMKIMTGLLCATEGKVFIGGHDVFKEPIEAKKQIGYLPETPPLYDELKVYDYLDFVCGLKSVAKAQRKQQIQMSVEKLQLEEVCFKAIATLSKGFRQRVGIAQALIGDPAVLILDEPSVGLDPHQVFELRKIIKDLKTHHTIVLSTHVLSEVQQVCDDVVILNRGEIKASGSMEEVLAQIQGGSIVEIKVQSAKSEFLEALRNHGKVQSVSVDNNKVQLVLAENLDTIDEFVQMTSQYQCGLISIQKHQPQLEEVFIEVTKK